MKNSLLINSELNFQKKLSWS